MSNKQNSRDYVRSTVPWIVAAGALVLYLVTLNHWVNLKSLPVVAKVTGWDWTLPVQWPLFFLLTFPIKFFPSSVAPLALNIFTALCSALTLGLLARSVALLPHDRTHEQRLRERNEFSLLSIKLAWLPPVLAALVCGLELTFWEHSTAVTGEALDLLVFAYLVRCLLEFRIDQRVTWLFRFALVYGLGVTNNWALVGFMPAFLLAMIWIRGLSFFNIGTLGKMFGFFLCGLLLYLLLPAAWVWKGNSSFSFMDVLTANLYSQRPLMLGGYGLRSRALILSLTSILPVLVIGFRFPSSFGETSEAGAVVTNVIFRAIHLVFLGACMAIAFDSKFSPRALGYGVPFLTFYYLGALAIGYYSGYALLVFSEFRRKGWHESNLAKIVNPIVRGAVILAAVGVPLGLIWQNWRVIQASNGHLLKEFAREMVSQLPKHQAYLLSDDPLALLALEGFLRSEGGGEGYVLVKTSSLENPGYQRELHRHYGQRWPEIKNLSDLGEHLDPVLLQQIVASIGSTNDLIYLQPSFGYYFEKFYPQPRGLVSKLERYENDQVDLPKLTEAQIADNSGFWTRNQPLLDQVEKAGRLDSVDAAYVAKYFSRGLNSWGIQLQRNEKIAEAGKVFDQAARINTNNFSAQINFDYNKSVGAGKPQSTETPQSVTERFQRKTWDSVLDDDGGFDEPFICFHLGRIFREQSLYRQSIHELDRTVHFQPTNIMAHLEVARAAIMGGWPDQALVRIATARAGNPGLSRKNEFELLSLEASAHFTKGETNHAEEILAKAHTDNPTDPLLVQSLVQIYFASGKYSNALETLDSQIRINPTNTYFLTQKAEALTHLEQNDKAKAILDRILEQFPTHLPTLMYKATLLSQMKDFPGVVETAERILKLDPDNVQALSYEGMAEIEQKQYDKAISAMTKALDKQPGNVTLLRNRAIGNLRADHLDEAKKDYLEIKKTTPGSPAVYYGLGEIAYKKKNFAEAATNYEAYLKIVPVEGSSDLMEERKQVEAKLQEVKSGKH